MIIAFEGVDGAGKTSLLHASAALLRRRGRVTLRRLAYELVSLYQDLYDAEEDGRYQSELDPAFRHATYLAEAAVQMRRDAAAHAGFDYVLFDRWLQTHWAYLEPPAAHASHYALLERTIPQPDLLVYVRVPAALALRRLVAKRDWMVARFGERELARRLELLVRRYDELFGGSSAIVVDGARTTAALADVVADRVASMVPAR